MSFTRSHARIAAGMLEKPEREALLLIANLAPQKSGNASEDTLDHLESLGFIRLTKNLLDGKDIAVVTGNGKKVAQVLAYE